MLFLCQLALFFWENLLIRPVNTSTEKFTNLLDRFRDMEHKYKLTYPKAIIFYPEYKELGPLGLVVVFLEWHSNLLADRMWTALTGLPQSNLTISARGTSNGAGRMCIICQDPGHFANRFLQRNNNGNMSSDQTVNYGNCSTCHLEEWKYCQPVDFTKPSRFMEKLEVLFKFKCCATGKEGIFQLSH